MKKDNIYFMIGSTVTIIIVNVIFKKVIGDIIIEKIINDFLPKSIKKKDEEIKETFSKEL